MLSAMLDKCRGHAVVGGRESSKPDQGVGSFREELPYSEYVTFENS